jgi:AcrR family transcriptional regulator
VSSKSQAAVSGKSRGAGSGGRVSSRNKRSEILSIATVQFGKHGFEDTKWADVAAEVGVGSTALYHYFETKLHCLYVIMAEAIEESRADFNRLTQGVDVVAGIEAVLRSNFELTDEDVQRLRVSVAEQGRVGNRRELPREEEARQMARARTQDLEVAWAMHLSRGMAQDVIPEADPQLMSRAVLGLYNSIWHWYRPGGILGLDGIAEFYTPLLLEMIGIEKEKA